MATALTAKSKLSEDSVFLLDTDVSEGFTYTADQYDDAVSFYRAKIAKTDKGRVPLGKAFFEWHKAGMPKYNSDDIKRERMAVSEGAGKSWTELTAEQYENYRKSWEEAGSPEPVEFLPRNARAKLIGKVLANGEETEDEQVVYIPGKLLDKYREEQGLTGPSGFDTFLSASEGLWKGKIVPHTLRTTSRTVKLVNGKPVTKNEAFKRELKEKLKVALKNRDFEALASLEAELDKMA